jgi:hypothetical protein
MGKQDEQQKMISFRVEERFLKVFEALKERFSVGGKATSTSDLARSFLEGAQAQQGEFGDLLVNQVEALKHIQELMQAKQPLRKAQWELVSFLIHRGYQIHRRRMVQGRYFKATLQALAAWRNLLGPANQTFDGYFLGNLGHSDKTALLPRLDELIDTMPELVPTSQAEYGTRNFNVAMRDDIQKLNGADLNDALMPFLPDLLPVAIRFVVTETKQPLQEIQPDYLTPAIRPLSSERYDLSVMCAGSSLTAGLSLSTHRLIHPINSFVQFQEFVQLLNEVTPENSLAQSDTYWLAGPSNTGDDIYYLRLSGNQVTLSSAEFHELKDLMNRAVQQPDLKHALVRMAAVYGDI